MNIYESAENYLEAILSLHERHGWLAPSTLPINCTFPSRVSVLP